MPGSVGRLTTLTGRPGFTMPCENQLFVVVRDPKKSPARTMMTRAPCCVAAQSALHFHADRALARRRILWRVFGQHRKGIGSVVVDRSRQHNRGTLGNSRADGVIEHRQHQLCPTAVARRIDCMHDDRAAAGRAQHVVPVHRVTADPGDAVALLLVARQPALERTHLPPRTAQLSRDLTTDAAAGAKHQYRSCLLRRHDVSPFPG